MLVGHEQKDVRRAGHLEPPTRSYHSGFEAREGEGGACRRLTVFGGLDGVLRELVQLRRAGPEEAREIEEILEVANHLHNIGDTISVNARAISTQLQERGLEPSEETREAFLDLITELEGIVAESVWAYVARDRELAERVIGLKTDVYRRARDIERHLGRRLVGGGEDQLLKYRLESEVLELLKRIYYFAKRIAKTVATDAPEPKVEEELAA